VVKKSLLFAAVLLGAMGLGAVLAEHRAREHDVVLPAKISKEDVSGTIFERPDTVTRTRGGNTIHRSCVICTPAIHGGQAPTACCPRSCQPIFFRVV